MKRLILNADDFGISPQVNAAVIRAYREGVLRYASLMVDREGAPEAVELARRNPGLGVGLHVELCSSDPAAWGMRYFFLPRYRRTIEPQIRAQIEKFLAFGLKPTHADGHCNIHVHPVVFPILADLARRYGIPRLRLPGGEAWLSAGYDRGELLPRTLLAGVFGELRAGLASSGAGLTIPDRTLGLLRSGTMSEEYLLWLIRRLPEGLTEIYCHPTVDPASEVVDRPAPGHHTVTELRGLLSPRVREALRESGVELASEGPERGPRGAGG